MKLKIIMDSGKEYSIDALEDSAKSFYESCLDYETGLPESNVFNFNEGKVLIDPRHISSIEEVEEK